QPLRRLLGPWALSGPARYLMAQALQDLDWQAQTRARLQRDSQHLANILTTAGLSPLGGTALFQSVRLDTAAQLADQLAAQGVLVRSFAEPGMLRFGLAADEQQWQRLQSALPAQFGD
ncbi:MAG TPA: aminotransferase class I/II-fold pyridoxal phosphate-dependent enzyme, partial [Pseudomonas sp.]|nr:aminotransferase class I/II-fold pyridoxal phosphate-dependent enzyme [Pseudomonas sp.]